MPPLYCSSSSNAFCDCHRVPRHQSYRNLPVNKWDQSILKEFSKITDSADSHTVSIFLAEENFLGIPQ